MTVKAKVAWIATGLILVVCGTGGALLLPVFDFPSAASELPRAMKEARAVDIPLTAAELEPTRPQRTSVIPKVESKDVSRPYSDLFQEKPDWGAVSTFVAERQSDLDELRRVTREGLVLPARDWDLGPDLPFPEYMVCKSAAKALCIAALYEAHQGNFTAAAQDLNSANAFGRVCAGDPTLIGLLVSIAIDSIVYRTAESCLALSADNLAGLRAIRISVLEKEPVYDLRNSFRGEAYMAVTTTRNLDQFGGLKGLSGTSSDSAHPPPNPKSLLRSGTPSNLVQKAYMTRSLQFWTKVFQYIKAHPQDRVGLAAYTDKLAAVEGDVQHGMSRILNGVMAPVFSQAIMAAIKGEADFRCHRALAFAMEYRAMYRTLPKSLNEAGFDLDDPFNGKPLHYKPGNGSLRVWSVGPDLKDDGGMARTGAFVNFDVVASYPPTILKR